LISSPKKLSVSPNDLIIKKADYVFVAVK
jgi:hypothetical protein